MTGWSLRRTSDRIGFTDPEIVRLEQKRLFGRIDPRAGEPDRSVRPQADAWASADGGRVPLCGQFRRRRPVRHLAAGMRLILIDGDMRPVRADLGIHTRPIGCAALPSLSVSLLRPGRLPLGLQLVGWPGGGRTLFAFATAPRERGLGNTNNPTNNHAVFAVRLESWAWAIMM